MVNITDNNQFRKDLILKEIEIIRAQISNYDKHSLIIKGWAITLWSALWLWIIQCQLFGVVFFVIVSIIPFWIMDLLYKYYQTGFMIREELIVCYLNEKLEKYIEGNDPSLILYDPTSSKQKYHKERHNLKRCLRLRHVSTLYTFLIGISFLGASYTLLEKVNEGIVFQIKINCLFLILFIISIVFIFISIYILVRGYHEQIESK